MNAAGLRRLFEYSEWAHRRVWACAETLDDEQYRRPSDYSMGSLHEQLVHTMSAEWIWLSRCKSTSPTAMLNPADFPSRDAVRARWDEIGADLRAYVDRLDDEALRQPVHYQTTKGEPRPPSTPLRILSHMVNHGTDHHGQSLALIHQLGGETVEQDMIRQRFEDKSPRSMESGIDAAHFRMLWDYNQWAHQRVWNCVQALTEDQFTQEINYSLGSIRNQLVHVMSADRGWFSVATTKARTGTLELQDFTTMAGVRSAWDDVHESVRAYLETATGDQLGEVLDAGDDRALFRWEIFAHMVNHGTDHRAQILWMLHQLGVETIAQDMIGYLLDPAVTIP